MKENSYKKRKKNFLKIFTKTRILIFLFFALFIGFNVRQFLDLQPKRTYYTTQEDSIFPIIYQSRNNKKINRLRGYRDEKYREIVNDTLTVLNDKRTLNLIIDKNGNNIKEIQYEIRNKTTDELIERTTMYIPEISEKEVSVSAQIQNLIDEKTTYQMVLKCDIGDKTVYYFLNIIYKRKNQLDEAIQFIEDFTEATFDTKKASEYVKYMETNPNVDQKQLFDVSIESSFEQITWGDTKMQRESEYYFFVYQAQDYCYNINIRYLTSCLDEKNEKEYYNVKDEYVIRWDEKRFYFMKFNRTMEEYLNIDNDIYDKEKKKFTLGVTNLDNFEKIESENKNYIAFTKNKEIYVYNTINHTIKNIYGYHINNEERYVKNDVESSVRLLNIDDTGIVRFLIYGYNKNGANEGLIGLSVFTYNEEENDVSQNIFVPIYSTYENLKYDLDKMCLFKNESLYFKSNDKIYSVDILNGNIMKLVENIEDATSEGSFDDLHFAYNEKGENYQKEITLVNMLDMSKEYIKARDKEKIQVITFMNDDLFYGVANEENEWKEANKTIGYPFKQIVVVNTITKETKVFQEEGFYFYNFVRKLNALHYNKYKKQGNHYIRNTNDVIINNYVSDEESKVAIKEEWTKRKLRIAYLEINTEKDTLHKEKQMAINISNVENEMLEREISKQKDIYYVYNNGVLQTKTEVLSDGIDAIRDTFGYVKMNDKITCYNRSNKGNVSYLRQNDSIMTNLEKFEENICLIDNKILVMNLTGVTCRDLEYYISLGEKVACFKNDTFQFFVTGYDNNNYVLEYQNKDRILTPRSDVQMMIEYEGYITFGQLTNLE